MARIQKIQDVDTLTPQLRFISIVGIICTVLLSSGCAQTYAKREVTFKTVAIERAPVEVSEDQLLDVRINNFSPGEISEDENEKRGISKEIRRAEGYLIAVNVRNAMQKSGYWGAVRVVPRTETGTELAVDGEILKSDGEVLKLKVTVTDARGLHWFTRDYSGVIDATHYWQYKDAGGIQREPFEFVFRQIANDIALYRAEFSKKELKSIRTVAELRFSADFAPDTFGKHLETSTELAKTGNRAQEEQPNLFTNFFKKTSLARESEASEIKPVYFLVSRLPSEDDPMLQRVRRLRIRENQVVDALDQHYERLAQNIETSYLQWRISRLTEMTAIRELETNKNEKMQKAVIIGVVGILAGAAVGAQCDSCGSIGGSVAGAAVSVAVQKSMEAIGQASEDVKIHKAALEELGQSLAADVAPVVIEVEGKTVNLKGTADAKFKQWRQVMMQLHNREVEPEAGTAKN